MVCGVQCSVVCVADRWVSRGGMTCVGYCQVFRVLRGCQPLNEEARHLKQVGINYCFGRNIHCSCSLSILGFCFIFNLLGNWGDHTALVIQGRTNRMMNLRILYVDMSSV